MVSQVSEVESATSPSPISVDALLIDACERRFIPDALLRAGIRRLLARRLRQEQAHDPALYEARKAELVQQLRFSPIAVATDAANAQHYEVPTAFYQLSLGPHLKYSSAWWPEGMQSLGDAEAAMLGLTCARAELMDGQRILELGCGWGSLSLWMAAQYPNAQIVSVSNSRTQKAFIDARAAERGLRNLHVITADANQLALAERFDRIVSVEMFEHMRNYQELLRRVSSWLKPDGQLFLHIFCHRDVAYPFEAKGDDDWMAKHFFTGGIMPSFDLFLHFQDHLRLEQRWWVEGTHYARTCEAWLRLCDQNADAARQALAASGNGDAERLRQRWRMFFIACAELFAYAGGREWGVGHYRFRPRA